MRAGAAHATGLPHPRPDEASAIQKVVLDRECEPGWLFDQTRRIADALAKGEFALVQIYGLRIPVANLDDVTLQRLAAASHLVKANFDPSQPRVPAGSPDGGQWIDAGSSEEDADLTDADDDEGWPADAGDDAGWPESDTSSPTGSSSATSSKPREDSGESRGSRQRWRR